jgi:predicted phosphate transport protein (TIGR00153 family)
MDVRFRLTPQDTSFFEMFAATGKILVEATTVLTEVIGSDQARRVELGTQMEEIEHRGDEAAHAVLRRVNSSFVTPFDREDIYQLTSRLDDCLDLMQAAVDLMVLYRIGELLPGVSDIVQVLARQAELTAEAMPRLRSLGDLSDYWVEINRLENQADQIHRRLVATLFDGDYDAISIMKHKEIIETLEDAADAFEHVAHTVETIAVKES